jgi:Skp family chaperone for outer membrane proteins
MKGTICSSLALSLFLAGAAAVNADPPAPVSGTQPAPDAGKNFVEQQRAARRDFHQKQEQDGKAFRAGLKGKSVDEQKSLREQFHARQKAERAAFNKDQKEKGRAYHAAHPSSRGHHRSPVGDTAKGK